MEKNRLFLYQLLLNRQDKYPQKLVDKIEDIMQNFEIKGEHEVDHMSEEEAGEARKAVEKAIEESGLKIDSFESNRFLMTFEQFVNRA